MNNESFIRWQGRTIEQMGYAANTMLVIAVATIGFFIDKLLDKSICPFSARWLAIVGTTILIFSVMTNLYLAYNRLNDYRNTAQLARKREKSIEDGKIDLRLKTKEMGKDTWRLFHATVVFSALGYLLIALSIGVAITYQ